MVLFLFSQQLNWTAVSGTIQLHILVLQPKKMGFFS